MRIHLPALRSVLLAAATGLLAALLSPAAAQQEAPPAAAATPAGPSLPQAQLDFLEAQRSASVQGLLAPSQTERDDYNRKWDSKAKEFLGVGREVRNWIGTVAEVRANADSTRSLRIDTTTDGKLTASFATDIAAGAAPDAARPIAATAPDLALASTLQPGQVVAFSGRVVTQKDGKLVLLASGKQGSPHNPVYLFEFTRLATTDQAAAEEAGARKAAEEAAAREAALREEAAKPPPTAPDQLLPNKYYRLTAVTPLRPDFIPVEGEKGKPAPEPAPPIQVPPDTMVFVHSTQMNGKAPWYNVTVDLPIAPARKKGWIDSKELGDQKIYEFYRYIQPTPKPDIGIETSYQNKPEEAAQDSRKPKPGQVRTVWTDSKGETYHMERCPLLRGSVRKLHIYDATKEDMKPCPRCFDLTK